MDARLDESWPLQRATFVSVRAALELLLTLASNARNMHMVSVEDDAPRASVLHLTLAQVSGYFTAYRLSRAQMTPFAEALYPVLKSIVDRMLPPEQRSGRVASAQAMAEPNQALATRMFTILRDWTRYARRVVRRCLH